MAHFIDKTHCIDKETLERLNTVLMLGLIGCGLAVCVLGAFVYDVSRLIAVW